MLKLPNGTIRVLVEGLERAEIVKYIEKDEEFIVELDKLEDVYVDKHEQEALMRQLIKQFEKYVKVSRKTSKEVLATVNDIDDPVRLTYMVASHLPLKVSEKQELLEIDNVKERLNYLLTL